MFRDSVSFYIFKQFSNNFNFKKGKEFDFLNNSM